jgi:hypothetical protein
MRILKVGLRDGFNQDEVNIVLDGKLVSQVSNVTSNPVVSFARDVSIELPRDSGDIRIEVPSRKMSASAQIDNKTAYLAVFLKAGKLELRPLTEELPVM